jgi:hypothetical protein
VLVNISVNLEVGGRGPGTDGQGDLVVEEVDDQVEVDRLLPVHVWVADRQFPAVPPGQEIRNHVLLHDLALNLRTFSMDICICTWIKEKTTAKCHYHTSASLPANSCL